MLANLHYFISDNRLCIHNLPNNFDDAKLRKLFLAAANDKKAKILWVRVLFMFLNVEIISFLLGQSYAES